MIHINQKYLPFWLTSGRWPIWYRYVLRGYATHREWHHYLTVFGYTFKWITRP